MLTFSSVSQSYGTKQILHDISLEVQPGTIYSLIGPNGSGKTTLLSLAAGLLPVQSGTVTIGNHTLNTEPHEAKKLSALVPDQPSIWPGMTGFEFLHFVGSLYGMSLAERTTKISELLPLFTLDGTEHDQFDTYSRGNKQKFSFMAALIHSPQLILIDEPIVGLDPISIEILLTRLRQFCDEGGSVFMVSHTLDVAERISDTIGLLHNGRLEHQGTLTELRDKVQNPEASLTQIYTSLLTQ